MTFKRRLAPPTAEQQRRQDMCRAAGCIACQMDHRPGTPAEIHHLTERGRTIGQDHTIALCPHHHRGDSGFLPGKAIAEALMGPSLALSPAAFRERYGDNQALLAYQNDSIGWAKPAERYVKPKKRSASPSKIVPREQPSWRKAG